MLRLALLIGLVIGGVNVGSPAAASEPPWAWPVRGAHQIVRPFIAPTTQYSAGHRGIDIAASGFVYAPVDGVVHFVGFVVDREVLSITHPGGVLSSYEPVSSTLAEGERVTRGQPIGTLETGHCVALCLHFGVRIDGQYVSPMLFLGGIPHSVLLPTRGLGANPAGSPATRRPGVTRASATDQASPGTRRRDSPQSVRPDSSSARSPAGPRCRGPDC